MKKLTSMLLVLLMVLLCACSPGTATDTPATSAPAAPTGSGEEGPVESESPGEITIDILFPPNSGLRPSMDTSKVWDYIYEETGIRFNLIINQSAEQKDLMFASRDYPDMMANVGASLLQLNTAAEAGDLVMLDPLLEQYAPTWVKFLEENPIVKNSLKLADGHIYTLPYCNHDPYDRELRDQWLYIYTWLDEIGKEVPKTTEEFKEVLLAIKEAAGTGTIPADVIPYYYLFDSYVGGQFDVYGSFGLVVTSADYLAVQEDGTVVCQAVNPDIKEPLKYLRELYELGLTPPECFTDDWNTYLSKISSNPPIVFSYGSFANRLPEVTYPMAPLDSGNGKAPVMRRQAYSTNPTHTTAIFSTCEYPEEIAKFFEWSTEYENAMTLCYGIKGVVWDVNEDGKMFLNFWESNQQMMNEKSEYVGFNNSWFVMLPRELYTDHFYNKNVEIVGTREWGFENIYRNYLPHKNSVYLSGTLDTEKTAMMDQYATDLNSYRKLTFANWITGEGNIDTEWDAYVEQMYALGLEEWLKLKQEAYDILVQ